MKKEVRSGWTLGFKGPPPALLLRPPPSLSIEANYMLSPLRCPLGFLLTLLPCSILCLWVHFYLSARQTPQALCFLAGHLCGVCTEASPNLSLTPRARHIQQCHLPPAVPITPTSGELPAGLSAAWAGDLHVSTNIYAHPGPSAPTFLGWPFTPGPDTRPPSGWICMRVYFWVRVTWGSLRGSC